MFLVSRLMLERKLEKMYPNQSVRTLSNLFKIMNFGALQGTGKTLILPVDQGFEHGPDKSFLPHPQGYNPTYLYMLAKNCGFSAIAAHLGQIQAMQGAIEEDWNPVPTILKLNANNVFDSFGTESPNQSIIGSVEDAARLGCVGVGFTIYPGSPAFQSMLNDLALIVKQARKYHLVVIVWAYPRGSNLKELPHISRKQAETSVDIAAYSAYMACSVGAHMVKVKLPTRRIHNLQGLFFNGYHRPIYDNENNLLVKKLLGPENEMRHYQRLSIGAKQKYDQLFALLKEDSVENEKRHRLFPQVNKNDSEIAASYFYEGCYGSNISPVGVVKRACFCGNRMVIFSGGEFKDDEALEKEVLIIASGGGDGSIIGRNAFQRSEQDAKKLVTKIAKIYKDFGVIAEQN